MKEQPLVFLGGTCNGSLWRNDMMRILDEYGFSYFNPVVDDWNEEAQKREIAVRSNATYNLYVLTPKMTGVYSIAEVVDDSNKCPEKTILVVLYEDGDETFNKDQWYSMAQVCQMVADNGAAMLINFERVAKWICDNEEEKERIEMYNEQNYTEDWSNHE